MKGRNVFGLVLSVMLLLLAAGSVLARGPQPAGPSDAVGVNADPAANAPWFIIEVDTPGNVGQYTSVAIDPSIGWTYVSYYDATNEALRLARYGGPGPTCDPNADWGCLTIDSGVDIGKYSSIAVNPITGGIGIAYHDATNGKLKFAYFANPHLLVHSTYTIDMGIFPVSSTGLYTSLKYDTNAKPYIAYYFDNPSGVDALMLAHDAEPGGDCGYGAIENTWRCFTIISGDGVGQYASLEVLGEGAIHIAYYEAGNGELWYATSSRHINCGPSDTWHCYPVDAANDVGQYASLYVDDDNHFHIAYYDATNEELKYAVEVDSGGNCGVQGSAQCDTIDTMQADYHPLGISIAEDVAGYPIIAYQSEYGSLNVARPVDALDMALSDGNCGPPDPYFPFLNTWYCETIDRYGRFIRWRNGDYVSIAVDPAGLATIAYYRLYTDFADGNLMVAYQRSQVFMPLVMNNP